jgi:predicted helicase
LIPKVERNIHALFEPEKIYSSLYRPFCAQYLYMGEHFIHRRGQFDQLFPTPDSYNLLICVSGIGVTKEFSCIITNTFSDLELIGKSQCFPLYWYEDIQEKRTLFDMAAETPEDYYARRDGISDHILTLARKIYGNKTSKEDVFYYVYALLHHPEYRRTFSADLKKTLPRVPLVEDSVSFWLFVKSGRALADLHLNYEDHADGATKLGVRITGAETGDYTVSKMRFQKEGKTADKSRIIYNDSIAVGNIPAAAYDYVVNGKSAIEWIMERYAVTTHKESGIVNDPNDWAREHNQPRYILDLLLSVITLSHRTVDIVNSLPKLTFA